MLRPCWTSNRVWWAVIHQRVFYISGGVFFFNLLISRHPYSELLLRHCTCHLSFESASPLCILSSFQSSVFTEMRLNFCLSLLLCPAWPAPLHPRVCIKLLGTCFDKHTANTFNDSAPFPLLSMSPSASLSLYLFFSQVRGAIFVSRFVCRFISPHRALSRFVTGRFISPPLSQRSGGNIQFLDISACFRQLPELR